MNSQVRTIWKKVKKVFPLENYCLQATFEDGQDVILNIKELIEKRDCYWRLRNPRYFKQVAIDPLGGICWPEGEDLAPDGLERYYV